MPARIEIKVELSDIMTGPVCSKLIIEFIKYVVYQRQQIPYNYQRLESVLKSKSKADEDIQATEPSLKAMKIDQEYVKVNEQFQSMQTTFKNLEEELNADQGLVEEVVVMLGATPYSPRDVYRLCLPPVQNGHLLKNHPPHKSLLNLYQSLIASEELHVMMRQQLCPTNVYVLLKKQGSLNSEGFFLKERFSLPSNGQQVLISLIPKALLSSAICHSNCTCFGIPVYKDDVDRDVEVSEKSMKIVEASCWYQARTIIKGFKDVKIDGVSVSNLW